MKKLLYIASLVFISTSILSSCASKKATKEATSKAVGDVEIKIPCSNFHSDKNFFRASQSSTSSNLASSREKALLMARQRLSTIIKSKMKSVSQRYAGDREVGGATEFNEKFENMTRDVVDQTLYDTRIACEKTMQKADGSYNTFIAVEIDKETIYNGVNNGISKNEKLRQDYDVMKFKAVFDEEMNKLEDEQK
jgi:hypothetical protein